MASDLILHSLPMTLQRVSRKEWVRQKFYLENGEGGGRGMLIRIKSFILKIRGGGGGGGDFSKLPE